MASTAEIEKLAAQIGENIYIDVAKWHLYLNDAHLHTVVAEKVYPLLEDQSVNEAGVLSILQNILVKLGGGNIEVPLSKLIPSGCQKDLLDLLEEYEKDM